MFTFFHVHVCIFTCLLSFAVIFERLFDARLESAGQVLSVYKLFQAAKLDLPRWMVRSLVVQNSRLDVLRFDHLGQVAKL